MAKTKRTDHRDVSDMVAALESVRGMLSDRMAEFYDDTNAEADILDEAKSMLDAAIELVNAHSDDADMVLVFNEGEYACGRDPFADPDNPYADEDAA